MRRRLFPTVLPKPLSKGSATNFPYCDVRVSRTGKTRLGSSRPRHRIRIVYSLQKTRLRSPQSDDRLDASLLRRTTTIVWKWRDVFDGTNSDAGRLQTGNRTFATRTRTFDPNLNLFDTKFCGSLRDRLR